MEIVKAKIPAVSCPWYVNDWISKWSGLECQDCTLEELKQLRPKTFLVDEDYIIANKEKVFAAMEENNINGMVIHALHIFKFSAELLEWLDEHSAGKQVHFISMSYKVKKFKNIIAHSHDLIEHGLAHDFNYILSDRLRSQRRATMDFLLMVNPKNEFRKFLVQKLLESGVLHNSITKHSSNSEFQTVLDQQEKILNFLDTEIPGNLCMDALRSWNALPDLRSYATAFCDIVVESANIHLDRRSDGELSDLSEKTYRPILLGIPFVFLGSKSMFEKLKNDGYQLVDDGNFYSKWHEGGGFEKIIPHLIKFLERIIVDTDLRKKLESMAEHNHRIFWTTRKLHHRTHNNKICRDCFGETVFDQIYDLLKD